jgi:hypothetical protein
MCDPAIAERRAAGAVGDQHRVFRPGHFDIVERDILHQLRRVDALLVARSDEIVEGHAGNCDDRRAIHMRVIEAVQKVDGAGSCRAHADAKLAGVLGESRSHERRGFFVTHADVFDPILTFAQRLDDGVDAIPHHAKAVGRAPGDQGFDHDIGGGQVRRELR